MGLFVKKLDPAKAVSSTLQTWLDKWWLHSPDTRARRSLVHNLQKIIDGRNGHVDDPLRTFLTENHDKLDESTHKRGRSNFNSILSAFVCQWQSFITDEGLDCPAVHFPLRDDDIVDMTDNEKARIMNLKPATEDDMIEEDMLDAIADGQFQSIMEQTAEPADLPGPERPLQMKPDHSEEIKVRNQSAVIDIWIPSGGEMIHITINTSPKQ